MTDDVISMTMAADAVDTVAVARMAGVDPSTVRKWRERYRDTFPAPIGHHRGRPRYRRTDIETWLASGPDRKPGRPRNVVASPPTTVTTPEGPNPPVPSRPST